MQPPRFWFTPPARPGLTARALAPLSAIFAAATRRRVSQPGYRASVPVICIGNLNVGGTGKTPTAIALAQKLQDAGHVVHIVSRGHGGHLTGPVQVDPVQHTADQTGDEPLLLAAFATVWVARDRAEGVRAAEAAGAGVILLDDGFQNPSVQKDLSLITVDAYRGFGNGRVLPAGPLREPVAAGLARADLLLSIGPPAARQHFHDHWGTQIPVPVLQGELQPLPTGMPWQGMPVLAFAGIGNPEKFFATLRSLGADLRDTRALDDHQSLSDALLARLSRDAQSHGAQLVTTEKDAVRLPPEYRGRVLTLPVRLHVADWTPLDQALRPLFTG